MGCIKNIFHILPFVWTASSTNINHFHLFIYYRQWLIQADEVSNNKKRAYFIDTLTGSSFQDPTLN